MFGINYVKAGPTQYVIHFQNGEIKRAGSGLAFFYFEPSSSIAVVPVGSADAPFIFNETTADFQGVTVQGQLTYRVVDPKLVASLLNYTVRGAVDRYVSDDPTKLPQRLVNLAQLLTRAELQTRPLRAAIQASDAIARAVLDNLRASPALSGLGVEALTFAILEIKPIPEIARALEAESREGLLRQADEAIYNRRNAAVEQERRIKENELNTEIAVEEKRRAIRETKVAADLAVEARQQQVREAQLAGQIKLEEERKRLVAANAENARTEAEAQAYATEASLRALRDLSPELLQMLAVQSVEPRLMVAMALNEIARNAGKIGQLNITPDLLETLMAQKAAQ
jgi:regulator of protease activity HflC (stomatin/prohibitin superfamily)